jgi:hypothetical protein
VEKTADSEELVCAVVNCRVYEVALFVVKFSTSSINPVTNTNFADSRSYTRQYIMHESIVCVSE